MKPVLQIHDLIKQYPAFTLGPVSLEIPEGSVTGLIGRNGAGKTTLIKSILRIVRPDSGEIRFFGQEITASEESIKQQIGYAGGAVQYYSRKKIRSILEVTKRFYPAWDDAACRRYMDIFSLDENKTPGQLSEGMKVKLSITIALSHGAKLLILDEPTSGLDPVSRDELLDILSALSAQGISILYSTHITSDLDKCADHIVYIRKGRLVAADEKQSFLNAFREKGMGNNLEEIMISCEKEDFREKLAR